GATPIFQQSTRQAEASSIIARCRARSSGSAGSSEPSVISSRYSLITADSNSTIWRSPSRTSSSGTLPSGDSSRHQSGLLVTSTWRVWYGTPLTLRVIADRWTNGHVWAEISSKLGIGGAAGILPEPPG